jgi:hypothetical protein
MGCAREAAKKILLLLSAECCAQGVYTPHLWLAQHQSTTYGGFLKKHGVIKRFTGNKNRDTS